MQRVILQQLLQRVVLGRAWVGFGLGLGLGLGIRARVGVGVGVRVGGSPPRSTWPPLRTVRQPPSLICAALTGPEGDGGLSTRRASPTWRHARAEEARLSGRCQGRACGCARGWAWLG